MKKLKKINSNQQQKREGLKWGPKTTLARSKLTQDVNYTLIRQGNEHGELIFHKSLKLSLRPEGTGNPVS